MRFRQSVMLTHVYAAHWTAAVLASWIACTTSRAAETASPNQPAASPSSQTTGNQEAGSRPRRERRPSLQELFDQHDTNKDGRVTAAELSNPGMMLMLDRDKDGVLTRREVSESVTDLGANRRWARVDPAKGSDPAIEPLAESPHPVAPAPVGVGRQLPAIRAKDLRGLDFDFGSRPRGKGRVIVATSSSCPVTRKFGPTLGRLEREWANRGFEFVYVGSIGVDPAADLTAMAAANGWQGPLVHDIDGSIGRKLRLRTTAEVIVSDSAGTVVYRGAVNDQYGVGYSRPAARMEPLQAALTAIERGELPPIAATTVPGCVIEHAAAPDPDGGEHPVTFHGRVSRILQTHCADCHHAGGVGPFPLESYQDVVGHAGMIRKQVEKGQMPPWFAAPTPGTDPAHSPWLNDRTLPEDDRRDLLAWLSGDRPQGNPAEAPLPRRWESGWAIGKPDAVFQIPQPVAIPADGVMAYQNVTVDTGLTEEKWITAMEIQPTAKAAVHHVLVFLRQPGARRGREGNDSSDEISGFFGAYVPGNTFQRFPDGFGKPIPAGSQLRFQIHYTPYGTATNDQMRIGFVFAAEKPRHRVHVVGVANPMIRIPAGAAAHEEYAALSVPRDARLLGFLPHMHVRGKAFRYEVVQPDGSVQSLLDVPRYDFNWQLGYRLAEPIRVAQGSRLRATAWYDNSAGNPANPDPTRTVKWGPQTFDEMMIGYIEYYFPDEGT